MQENRVILSLEDIYLSFGGVQALAGVNIDIKKDEILALIGPNGSGKTSILNSISGFYRPQKGNIYLKGKRINNIKPSKIAAMGVARTFQNLALYRGLSTVDNILSGRHIMMKQSFLSGFLYFGPALKTEVEHRRQVEYIMDFLELEPYRHQHVGVLPYGVRKRVELGRALAMEPKVLLLDEPMAGMNMEEKEDMARYVLDIREAKWETVIKESPAIVLVEHEMDVVMGIAERVVALDWGKKIAEGTPDEIKNNQAVIKAYLGEEEY
ncbi:MAG: ABC transporter ATP-binding protein [Deltaproteobacteria bacterium]|jgi:branched-chain amino acid transport system ATP-binding protein|nr:MAG: ABC transporter ATP-binding protein [Deltaproteobacteria bacterium]